MTREDLLQEHRKLVDVLVEKTKFVYSEEFYALDDFERQKYAKDKMATEGHLGTLSNLLWNKMPQFGSMSDFFGLALISSMFGNNTMFGASPSNADWLKAALEKSEDAETEE